MHLGRLNSNYFFGDVVVKKISTIILFSLIVAFSSKAQELRSAWLSRNELTSKAQIAQVMDSLANNHFNVAYVDCWTRGYPLWQSEAFQKETGMLIDPTYNGRDVLQEAIAEAHRRGIEVEAWFEYGFVGGYTGWYPGASGKGKIFDVHPDWVASKQGGIEKDNSNFFWMTQTRPEVQAFLLSLITEVARKYDIDGIDLDRIRYAGNGYGYDAYTDSVYRFQHNGAAPPTNTADSSWMRWRADILNRFMRAAYDSVKAINPRIYVTNAPGFYSSSTYDSYNTNLQDWWEWVRDGSVDMVQVQMYVSDNTTFDAYLSYLMQHVNPKEKMYPALAVAPNGNQIPTSELTKMVVNTRNRGLKGNAWWYVGDFTAAYWSFFGNQLYPAMADVPGRPAGWRIPAVIVNETDTSVVKTGQWTTSTYAYGYQSKYLFTDSTGTKSLEYWMTVPFSAWYEVYAFQPNASLATSHAPFEYFDSTGTATLAAIDQSKITNAGWVKLGDAFLSQGYRKVVRITNNGIEKQRSVNADAVMIVLNRKLSPNVITTGVPHGNFKQPQPENFRLGQNYPNPFNPTTHFRFTIADFGLVTLKVYDVLGRKIATLVNERKSPGTYEAIFDGSKLTSGIYFYQLRSGNFISTRRMVLLK